ncbi:MAG: preprotein translocase, SecE subunit [Parcubacteria bacterium C7867-001]|nr:MAG: preprotein translocase, SecE subunit [Parcubacteria bacterium C7867-001]
MKSLVSYLSHVRTELSHVVWPSWQKGVSNTVLIIIISVVVALFIAGLDYLFTTGVAQIISQ